MSDECSACGDLVARFEMVICERCGCYVCDNCTEITGTKLCPDCAPAHKEKAADE